MGTLGILKVAMANPEGRENANKGDPQPGS